MKRDFQFDLTLEKGGREGREEEEEEWNAIHRGRSFAAKMAQLMLNIMLTSNPGDIRDPPLLFENSFLSFFLAKLFSLIKCLCIM